MRSGLGWLIAGGAIGAAIAVLVLNSDNEPEYATGYDGVERAAGKTFGWGIRQRAGGKMASVAGREPAALSAREFSLLHALLLRPGAILSRRELEDRIYGWGEEVESNAVEFLIHGLRRKLGADIIRNVRGLGWMVSKRI